MANEEQLAILKQGVDVWNEWRHEHPDTDIDFRRTDLKRINLEGVNLKDVNLYHANLEYTNLNNSSLEYINLEGANLSNANLSNSGCDHANLEGANLSNANLSNSSFNHGNLTEANLTEANLNEASFWHARLKGVQLINASLRFALLHDANLSGADLNGANLDSAIMVGTQLQEANLSNCRVFGISAWNVNLEGAIQSNLIITDEREPVITVDNLEIAQFIYLLIHNEKLRDVIDTITSKAVLILGRFTPERLAVLQAIREELRKRDYIPILFDFDKPESRDVTETVGTLAHLSRFVIADLTDPKSIPHELMSFVEKLPSVAVQPLILKGQREYGMFEHFQRYPWVLLIHEYKDQAQLIAELADKVIAPAEAKVIKIRPTK